MQKGQTATEYLVILAVVLVIGLLVVSVLGGVPLIGGSGLSTFDQQEFLTTTIGFGDISVVDAGALFTLINNNQNTITIHNISMDNLLVGLKAKAYPIQLRSGQRLKVSSYLNSFDGQANIVVNYTDQSTGGVYSDTLAINYQAVDDDIEDGLVYYWSFDEYNSTHTQAAVGGADARFEGNAATTASGKMGRGLLLDGILSYANVTTISVPTTGTISVWINPANMNGSSFPYRFMGASNTFEFILYHNGSFISDAFSDGGSTVRSSEDYTEADTWYHYVATWDFAGDNLHQLFINGALVDSDSSADDANSGSNFGMGFRPSVPSLLDQIFNGTLDEVMIWNVELTPTQIRSLYQIGQ